VLWAASLTTWGYLGDGMVLLLWIADDLSNAASKPDMSNDVRSPNSTLLRIATTLYGLPHVVAGLPAPLVIFGLALKLGGVPGNPLDISMHPRQPPSDAIVWGSLLFWSTTMTLWFGYGSILIAASWSDRMAARWSSTGVLIAGVVTALIVVFLGWLMSTAKDYDREVAIAFGLGFGIGYALCNVAAVWSLKRLGSPGRSHVDNEVT
jgi:hypothetical protein